MEGKDFKNLIKEREKIEKSIEIKDERINAIRKDTKKKRKELKKQRDTAIAAINSKFDIKIAQLKQATKQKLFLLKDKKEFSLMKADQIDDEICSEFNDDPTESDDQSLHPLLKGDEIIVPLVKNNLLAETMRENEKVRLKLEVMHKTRKEEIELAITNFRYRLNNEATFKKEYKELRSLLLKISKPNIDSWIVKMDGLLAGKSVSRTLRDQASKELTDFEREIFNIS